MNAWKVDDHQILDHVCLHHSQYVSCKGTWYGHQKMPIPLIKLPFIINQKYSCHMLNSSISRIQHHDMIEVRYWGPTVLRWPVNFTVTWHFMQGACEQIYVFVCKEKKCNHYAENMRHHCTNLVTREPRICAPLPKLLAVHWCSPIIPRAWMRRRLGEHDCTSHTSSMVTVLPGNVAGIFLWACQRTVLTVIIHRSWSEKYHALECQHLTYHFAGKYWMCHCTVCSCLPSLTLVNFNTFVIHN